MKFGTIVTTRKGRRLILARFAQYVEGKMLLIPLEGGFPLRASREEVTPVPLYPATSKCYKCLCAAIPGNTAESKVYCTKSFNPETCGEPE